MSDETVAPAADIACEERAAVLANLVLAQKIFDANIAQQQTLIRQQLILQIELAALGKCLQVLLAAETTEPEAIERLTAQIVEMLGQVHSKSQAHMAASHEQISEAMAAIQARAMA